MKKMTLSLAAVVATMAMGSAVAQSGGVSLLDGLSEKSSTERVAAPRMESQAPVIEEQSTPTFFEFDIASPIQLPIEQHDVSGLRLGLFWGDSLTLKGVDISLLGAAGLVNMYGLEYSLFNSVSRDTRGLQIGVLGNYVGLSFVGAQISAFLNMNTDDSTGFELACVNNNSGFVGGQIGAICNWNSGAASGIQLSSIINRGLNSYSGLSISAINLTPRFSGCQIGVFNIASDMGAGLQLGLFNAAGDLTGLQIGVMNFNGTSVVPTLPVINANF